MHRLGHIRSDESGLSKLEMLGLFAFVASLLAMVPFVREFVVNAIGVVFNQVDPETGHPNDFSVALRGFAITIGAVLALWSALQTEAKTSSSPTS